MSNIMTTRTKQNPFFLFLGNKFFLTRGNYFGHTNIGFAIHPFVVMMKSKSSDRQIIGFAIKTFITKFQDKFSFGELAIFSSFCKILFRMIRHTRFTIAIYTKTISVIFRKINKFFTGFTARTPFMSLAIYYRIHHNSIAQSLTVNITT